MMNTMVVANMIEANSGTDYASLPVRPHPRARCPKCASIIYSRKSHLCGVCGITLPSNLLFNDAQRAYVTSLLTEERERHRAWLTRRTDTPTRATAVAW